MFYMYTRFFFVSILHVCEGVRENLRLEAFRVVVKMLNVHAVCFTDVGKGRKEECVMKLNSLKV